MGTGRKLTQAVVTMAGLALSLAAHPAHALTVAEWAEAYEKPALGGAGVPAAGRTLELDHLHLRFRGGRIHPVVVADRIAGLYFHGAGDFRYVSADAYEAPIFKRNVEQASSYKVAPDGSVGDTFESALVMFSDREAAEAACAAGIEAAGGEPPAAARDRFRRHLERWDGDWNGGYAQLLAQARVDPPADPAVWVELQASRHDVLYVKDTLRASEESLQVTRSPRSGLGFLDERRYRDRLSLQPLGRSRIDPLPLRFVLTHLDVEIVNPEDRRARIAVRETFEARTALKALDLRLRSAIVGTVGRMGRIRAMEYQLLRVTDAVGGELAYARRNDDLVVELGRTLAPGERIELSFELAGDILFRPNNDSYWHLGGPWYPTPGRWAMESFTYHAVVKAAEGFLPFSNGSTVRRWTEGALNCAEFRETESIQGAIVLAGKYTTYTEERGGVVVRVSSYAIPKEEAKLHLAKLAHDLIEFYEPLLGPYPFRELNVLEINGEGFGQAPAGVIFITKEAFAPTAGEHPAKRLTGGIDGRFAHEVAHAWWGHVAKLSDHEDQWLSESLADYCAAFAMGVVRKGQFQNSVASWRTGAERVAGKWSLFLANDIEGEDSSRVRRDLLYDKGPFVLHALRQEVGDHDFFEILRSALGRYTMQPVWTRDFIATTNRVTKRDFGPWFARYVFGAENPKLAGK